MPGLRAMQPSQTYYSTASRSRRRNRLPLLNRVRTPVLEFALCPRRNRPDFNNPYILGEIVSEHFELDEYASAYPKERECFVAAAALRRLASPRLCWLDCWVPVRASSCMDREVQESTRPELCGRGAFLAA